MCIAGTASLKWFILTVQTIAEAELTLVASAENAWGFTIEGTMSEMLFGKR